MVKEQYSCSICTGIEVVRVLLLRLVSWEQVFVKTGRCQDLRKTCCSIRAQLFLLPNKCPGRAKERGDCHQVGGCIHAETGCCKLPSGSFSSILQIWFSFWGVVNLFNKNEKKHQYDMSLNSCGKTSNILWTRRIKARWDVLHLSRNITTSKIFQTD
jgi:hypothetical protein